MATVRVEFDLDDWDVDVADHELLDELLARMKSGKIQKTDEFKEFMQMVLNEPGDIGRSKDWSLYDEQKYQIIRENFHRKNLTEIQEFFEK